MQSIEKLAVAGLISLTTFLTACNSNNGISTVNNQDVGIISSNTAQNQLEAVVKLVRVNGRDTLKFNTKNDSDGYVLVLEDDKGVVKTADVSLNKEGQLRLVRGLSYRLLLKNKENNLVLAKTDVFVADLGLFLELTVETAVESSLVSVPVTIREIRKENPAEESIDFSGASPAPTSTATPTSTPVDSPSFFNKPLLLALSQYDGSDGLRTVPKKDFVFIDANKGEILKTIKNPSLSDLNSLSLNASGDFLYQPATLNYSTGSNLYSKPVSVTLNDSFEEFVVTKQEEDFHYFYQDKDRVEKRIVNPEYWISTSVFIANNNIYQIKDDASNGLIEITEEEYNRIAGNFSGGDVNSQGKLVAVYNRGIALIGANRLIQQIYYFGDWKNVTNPRFKPNSDKVLFLEKDADNKWFLKEISTTSQSTPSQFLDISSLVSITKPTRVMFEYDLYNNIVIFAYNSLHSEVLSYNLTSGVVNFSKTYAYKNLIPTRVFYDNGFKMNNNNKVVDSFENSYHQPTSSNTVYSEAEHTYSSQDTQTYVPGGATKNY